MSISHTPRNLFLINLTCFVYLGLHFLIYTSVFSWPVMYRLPLDFRFAFSDSVSVSLFPWTAYLLSNFCHVTAFMIWITSVKPACWRSGPLRAHSSCITCPIPISPCRTIACFTCGDLNKDFYWITIVFASGTDILKPDIQHVFYLGLVLEKEWSLALSSIFPCLLLMQDCS